jgi:hypothetical protein
LNEALKQPFRPIRSGASTATGVRPKSKKHDWNKEQPHHVDTGRIVKKDWAEKHPNKVEWVKNK